MFHDRRIVARTVRDLRPRCPRPMTCSRGCSGTVLEVDGAGLTLVHEDGPPGGWPPPTRPWSCWNTSSTTSAKALPAGLCPGPGHRCGGPGSRARLDPDRRGGRPAARRRGLERPGPPCRASGGNPGCVHHPTAGLDRPRARGGGRVRVGGRRAGPGRGGAGQPGARSRPAAPGADQPGLDRAGQRSPSRHPGHRP